MEVHVVSKRRSSDSIYIIHIFWSLFKIRKLMCSKLSPSRRVTVRSRSETNLKQEMPSNVVNRESKVNEIAYFECPTPRSSEHSWDGTFSFVQFPPWPKSNFSKLINSLVSFTILSMWFATWSFDELIGCTHSHTNSHSCNLNHYSLELFGILIHIVLLWAQITENKHVLHVV